MNTENAIEKAPIVEPVASSAEKSDAPASADVTAAASAETTPPQETKPKRRGRTPKVEAGASQDAPADAAPMALMRPAIAPRRPSAVAASPRTPPSARRRPPLRARSCRPARLRRSARRRSCAVSAVRLSVRPRCSPLTLTSKWMSARQSPKGRPAPMLPPTPPRPVLLWRPRPSTSRRIEPRRSLPPIRYLPTPLPPPWLMWSFPLSP